MKVLVIEDDRRLAALIARVLGKEGIAVDQAYDGEAGLHLLAGGAYDVAIVDWMLPERDGPSVCRGVRAQRLPTALLMLTARREVEDRVTGLESGADDYLGKPFAFEELLARVRALGRRFALVAGEGDSLRSGDLETDLRRRVARRGDHVLDLTPTEWNQLECFLRHQGQALSRSQILDRAWSFDRASSRIRVGRSQSRADPAGGRRSRSHCRSRPALTTVNGGLTSPHLRSARRPARTGRWRAARAGPPGPGRTRRAACPPR